MRWSCDKWIVMWRRRGDPIERERRKFALNYSRLEPFYFLLSRLWYNHDKPVTSLFTNGAALATSSIFLGSHKAPPREWQKSTASGQVNAGAKSLNAGNIFFLVVSAKFGSQTSLQPGFHDPWRSPPRTQLPESCLEKCLIVLSIIFTLIPHTWSHCRHDSLVHNAKHIMFLRKTGFLALRWKSPTRLMCSLAKIFWESDVHWSHG